MLILYKLDTRDGRIKIKDWLQGAKADIHPSSRCFEECKEFTRRAVAGCSVILRRKDYADVRGAMPHIAEKLAGRMDIVETLMEAMCCSPKIEPLL